MIYFRRLLLFTLLILSQICGLSQKQVFNQLSVSEGLSHSDAISIVQDDYSYLWIGTNSGLNKYDGYSIKKYKWDPHDRSSLPGNRILKLISTKDKIWILIENSGLYYFDLLEEKYLLVKSLPKVDNTNFILELDQQKNLWLYEKSIGLVKYFLPTEGASANKNWVEESIHFRKTGSSHLKCFIDGGKDQFFSDANGVIYKFSAKAKQFTIYDSIKCENVQAAFAFTDSLVLFSTTQGLVLWNKASKNKQKVAILSKGFQSKEFRLNCILKNNQTYYLGTENGMYSARLLANKGLQLVIDQQLIANIKVNDLYKDKFNILWIASSGYGLFYSNLKQLPFAHIHPSDFNSLSGFSENFTSAILKKKNSDILMLGTLNGVFKYNVVLNQYTGQIKELTNQHVRFLFEDSAGDLWIGTRENGVYRFRNDKLIKHFRRELGNNNSISSDHIISISEDQWGRIWLANYTEGVDIYSKETELFHHLFSESFNSQSLASNNLTYLFFEKGKNYMYISSRDAGITIIRLGGKNEFHFSHLDANNAKPFGILSSNYIWSINATSPDTILVGTIGGGVNILTLNKNNEYKAEYVTRVMGLADNDIESILIDKQKRVWMGGQGLSVYDLKTKKISNYDVSDGLQSNSFKIGSSFYDEQKGIMYFGGVNGVNYFDPGLINKSKLPADIAIDGIEILNVPVGVGDTINNRVLLQSKLRNHTFINLKAAENEFSIHITPLNFISPKKNKIRYRLIPYQEKWIERSYPDFKASYSNLPAGDYTLEIQSSNHEDEWSSNTSVLNVRIDEYWYKSNDAILLYILGILGLFYFYHIQTTARQKIKEKLSIAENEQLVSQGKLDFFTNISHEIRTPLTLIAGPLNDLIKKRETVINTEETLTSMSRHVNRLLNMVNRLLDFRKMELGHEIILASPTKINEFAADLFMFFKEKAHSKKINYELINLSKEITLYIDQEKIETILINLLSNAFKFTPNNGNITMKLEINGDANKDALFNKSLEPIENYVEISIADTGIGIPNEKKDKIFNQYYQIEENARVESIGNGIGLALVKSICTLHHLKINVKNNVQNGSVFLLRLPLGKQYLGNNEIKAAVTYSKFKTPIALDQNPEVELNKSSVDLVDRAFSSNKKLLIVEDNPEIRLYLNQHLKKYFKVLNAENGNVGFDMAMKERPDIIISDVMMPEMNGMEFSKLIKTNDQLHHIPIILLTALTSTSHELEGLKLGIEDYIRKPFDMEILLAKIFAILENRRFISEYYARQLHFTPQSTEALTKDEIFLQQLIKFVGDNLSNHDINVGVICKQMAMSRTSLYVKIKEITGRSIVEFVRDIRLKKAEELLLSSSENIDQIAYEVGINDIKYFRKHFKETFGMSPVQYRIKHSKSNNSGSK